MVEAWPPARHLAWLCSAPQLLASPHQFGLADWLPADWTQRLERWARYPVCRPAALTEPAHPRLGHYFERLYACVLTDILGWDILASNLQVRDDAGRTLGELDFLVRNRQTGQVEHHEIAVKFYLGYRDGHGDQTLWYGPNSHDRLDRKVTHLLQRQSRLCQHPEARAVLAELGVTEAPLPRVFMPGYLFYPEDRRVTLPAYVPANHLRGRWLYHRQCVGLDCCHWVPLQKPHWLGPWTQPTSPCREQAESALASVAQHHRPRLFAVLDRDPVSGLWHETERTFVVPDRWPAVAGR